MIRKKKLSAGKGIGGGRRFNGRSGVSAAAVILRDGVGDADAAVEGEVVGDEAIHADDDLGGEGLSLREGAGEDVRVRGRDVAGAGDSADGHFKVEAADVGGVGIDGEIDVAVGEVAGGDVATEVGGGGGSRSFGGRGRGGGYQGRCCGGGSI